MLLTVVSEPSTAAVRDPALAAPRLHSCERRPRPSVAKCTKSCIATVPAPEAGRFVIAVRHGDRRDFSESDDARNASVADREGHVPVPLFELLSAIAEFPPSSYSDGVEVLLRDLDLEHDSASK